MDENRLLWNAVFAADIVAQFRQQVSEGKGHGLEHLPSMVEDSECLATEVVLALQSFKLKQGK